MATRTDILDAAKHCVCGGEIETGGQRAKSPWVPDGGLCPLPKGGEA